MIVAAALALPAPAIAAGGTITGTVTMKAGGAAPDVCVQVQDRDRNWTTVASKRTLADGTYRLDGVPAAGRYLLLFSGEASCDPQSGYGEPDVAPTYQDGTYNGSTAATFALADGKSVQADIALAVASHISGTVRDTATGSPIGGLNVFAHARTTSGHGRNYQTDAAGQYDIGYLAPGSYVVQISNIGSTYRQVYYRDAMNFADATLVTVGEAGRAVADQNTDRGGTLAGRITDSAGQGLSRAGVTVLSGGVCCGATAYADSDGNYQLGGLQPGSYRLSFSGGTYFQVLAEFWSDRLTSESGDAVQVQAGQITRADASLAAGGSMTGRAVMPDGTEPPVGTCVEARDSTASGLPSTVAGARLDGSAWIMTTLRPGSYAVRYYACDPTDPAAVATRFSGVGHSFPTARHIQVQRSQVTTVAPDTLQPGGSVSGVVKAPNDGPVPGGVRVQALRDGYPVATAPVDGAGRYVVRGLAEGTWRLRVQACANTGYGSSDGTVDAAVLAGQQTQAPDQYLTTGPGKCPPPPAPTGVAAKAGPGSLAVRWNPLPPDLPNAPIQYKITLDPGGRVYERGLNEADVIDGAIIAGLPTTAVRVRVQAYAEYEDGAASAWSNTVTPMAGAEAEPERPEPGPDVAPSVTPSTAVCSPGGLTVRVNTPTINATGLASVTVVGAAAGQIVELQGYSQNHYGTASFANDPTPVDRTAVADASGSVILNDLRPASNTRVRARAQGCPYPAEPSTGVIGVRTQLTLFATRIGTRTYRINGKSTPARDGGLIVGLYRRSASSETLVAQVRADAEKGLYALQVRQPATDVGQRVELVVKTGRDAQNVPGRSNSRVLTVS